MVEAELNLNDGTLVHIYANDFKELFREIETEGYDVKALKAKVIKTGDMRQGKCK